MESSLVRYLPVDRLARRRPEVAMEQRHWIVAWFTRSGDGQCLVGLVLPAGITVPLGRLRLARLHPVHDVAQQKSGDPLSGCCNCSVPRLVCGARPRYAIGRREETRLQAAYPIAHRSSSRPSIYTKCRPCIRGLPSRGMVADYVEDRRHCLLAFRRNRHLSAVAQPGCH